MKKAVLLAYFLLFLNRCGIRIWNAANVNFYSFMGIEFSFIS